MMPPGYFGSLLIDAPRGQWVTRMACPYACHCQERNLFDFTLQYVTGVDKWPFYDVGSVSLGFHANATSED